MYYINDERMEQFFSAFDVIRNKVFCNYTGEIEDELQGEIRKLCYKNNGRKYWDAESAVNTYRTLEKVYDWEDEKEYKYCDLLQKIIEELLGAYVGIDGIQDLFRSSYFYFEWMMHLEYMEQKHSYSYYRDHYLHQIRNLYEMFVFMDEFQLWTSCMNIYRDRNDIVANRMKESIQKQIRQMQPKERRILKKACDVVKYDLNIPSYGVEELCYRDLLFSVTIVSALVHDIGYPICYMKRTLNKMRRFLPLSSWFMNTENTIPKINALLKDSLLYEVAGSKEIEQRLNQDDHGTYSAIALLIQYYDSGQIHNLEPLKRMVIELSALVIYNHTLRYHFQGKGSNRYDNVYVENPLSYLFRLCDDLQEWERVYFEISNQGNLFICDCCKMPMINNLKKEAVEKGDIPYTCFCNRAGINTNMFNYRKMMTVAPFEALNLQMLERGSKNEVLNIEMRCNLRALLQMVKYRPAFAVQRVGGICEIKDMVESQTELPLVYVETFVSNNPFSIKSEILRRFLEREREKVVGEDFENIHEDLIVSLDKNFCAKQKLWQDYLKEMKGKIETALDEKIIEDIFPNIQSIMEKDIWNNWKKIIKNSICFYFFLIILGEKMKLSRDRIINEDIKNKLDKSDINELLHMLYEYFESLSDLVADVWNIYDIVSRALIADCLQQMFCEVSVSEFVQRKHRMLYRCRFLCRKDMVELITAYTRNDMYKEICEDMKRTNANGEMLFDFYSDYYFFYEMEKDNERCKNPS